jgi:hypothetical protein
VYPRQQGAWQHGKRHGVGVCEFAESGRRFRGAWERDAWVQSTADPALCKLRGPGLARAVAGAPARFALTARDEDRNARLCGGDTFVLWLQRPTTADANAHAPPPLPRIYGAVADNGDGSYGCSYVATAAGAYELHVCSADGEPVADSPYPVRVLAGAPAPRACVVEGPGRRAASVGIAAAFTVAARDAHGNACAGALADALPLDVAISGGGGGGVAAEVTDTGRGLYVVTYTPKQASPYGLVSEPG